MTRPECHGCLVCYSLSVNSGVLGCLRWLVWLEENFDVFNVSPVPLLLKSKADCSE